MLCPPANLSARVGIITAELGLYSFPGHYQLRALTASAHAEVGHLDMSQILKPQEDLVFL
jgi:hypothetical protein